MLLVQPPQGTSFGLSRILNAEPLGLEYVGAALRRSGHDAEILDLRIDDWSVLERALDDPPAAVGISCAFTTDVYPTWEVARFVKAAYPALPVVVGGHHASLVPRDFVYPRSPVDAVVVGEGEATCVELLEALGRGRAGEGVAGVATAASLDRGIRRREFTRRLDELPLADRSLTARYRSRYYHGLQPRSASLETSRGCPFDCNFCSVWVFYGRRAGSRSPASIVRELETIEEEHVFFTDDVAFLDRAAYEELGERVAASGIRKEFAAETRTDLVLRHRRLFERWRAIGLRGVFLGVEKIDDAGLAAVRKRTRGGSDASVEAIRVLRESGITPMTTFITDPAWGEEEFDRLEEFIDRLRLPNSSFTVLTPLPGTELYAAREHELTTLDYGYYDVMHAVLPTRLPIERFYERVASLYRSALEDVRPTLKMARRALGLALEGNLWLMRRVYGAARQVRTAPQYLQPPLRVRAPRPTADAFALPPRHAALLDDARRPV